ncbi:MULTISPECIES: KTSC domain-containing protein [unclassified Nostoc]|uniref:KTSC domain-containing protein n=1 Tax=unclassified Nostoc TaxID=2593658 RepID=UPI0025AADB5B|nr:MULTISPECIES: KTSC domain-containing protein [unclassified Nostoc]MDM9584052.1 KTSC domain-containing protein [Nostoc sp. GT001]MDZ7943682.1 KTSC domain-containing protein [Nostoc sp. EfeVER01]MDZ7991689.1 KTSC domain-containing protein [Nostoc sp. EspVER01]
MKLSKIDLSSLVAIAHSDGYLQLLLDRGNELEFLEIPAPIQAYEGLQELNEAIAETTALPFEEEPIVMLPVVSSMAMAVGYDRNEQILQVEFQSGAVYQYLGVDEDTWEDLHSSDSIGSFFNQEIKGRYECDRLDHAD